MVIVVGSFCFGWGEGGCRFLWVRGPIDLKLVVQPCTNTRVFFFCTQVVGDSLLGVACGECEERDRSVPFDPENLLQLSLAVLEVLEVL